MLDELGLKPDEYFLVSSHREENVDDATRCCALIETLNALADQYRAPIIFSTHPRTRRRLDAIEGLRIDPLVRFLRALWLLRLHPVAEACEMCALGQRHHNRRSCIAGSARREFARCARTPRRDGRGRSHHVRRSARGRARRREGDPGAHAGAGKESRSGGRLLRRMRFRKGGQHRVELYRLRQPNGVVEMIPRFPTASVTSRKACSGGFREKRGQVQFIGVGVVCSRGTMRTKFACLPIT